MTRVETGPGWELRLGRWQDVLSDVKCDALITDPPYSERTHAGQRTGSSTRTPTIEYRHITESEVLDFANKWSAKTARWAVVFSDNRGFISHSSAWEFNGWYSFAPVVWVKDVYAPRLSGDGPACGCEYVLISRPRRRLDKPDVGSRPGWYMVKGRYSCDAPSGIAGQKDIGGMRRIVRDYSRQGDIVCDPYAGSGTTLLAAVMEGRRAIGAEMDEGRFEIALKRLRAGYTPPLFS